MVVDVPPFTQSRMSAAVLSAFDTHVHSIEARLARATERLRLLSLVDAESASESTGDKRKRERDEQERRIDDVAAAAVAELGAPLPSDEYEGDGHLRTLRKLLARIDARGYERSAQQLQFHASFEIATARILYKQDWALKKPDIVRKHGWGESYSEVLISTPRRFGKTFSIAMFSACFALSMSTEVRWHREASVPPRALTTACCFRFLQIVIFSPARRASR